MSTTTGNLTDGTLGPWRTAALATSITGRASSNMIDVPPVLSNPFTYQEPGAHTNADMGLRVTRQDLKHDFTVAHNAKTAYPWTRFTRGTAGNLCSLVEGVELATIPNNEEVGVWNEGDYALTAGTSLMQTAAGVLFDHTMAHATTGVTAPVAGTVVQVGAVSATQSLKILMVNSQDPTATWTGASVQVESDPVVGFTTATLRGAALSSLATTPTYSFQTIAGPITDTYWRANVTAVASGAGYPIVLIWIVDN